MRRILGILLVGLLVLTMSVSGQEATPEMTEPVGESSTEQEATPEMMETADAAATAEMEMGGENSLTVTDQVSLNGMVVIESANIANAGFIAIHADEGGMPGHVVGVAPVAAGTNSAVSVMIDGAMATPVLYAQLHSDDSETGVFEFGKVPGADAALSDAQQFTAPAIVSFDQQVVDNTVVVASALISVPGWLVIHADEAGQPGAILGSAPLIAGTNAPVYIPLNEAPAATAVWAMLHVDDGTVGTFEYDGQNGLDAPVNINEVVATRPINLTDAPTVLLADGTPIQGEVAPAVNAAEQELAPGDAGASNFVVSSAVSPAAGFIDVHGDMGHPSVSLGVSAVAAGENTDVAVALMPPAEGTMMTAITPIVWPMLHLDTDADGQYRYLMIPGVDLPVVYNGAVATLPVTVSGDMVMAMEDMMGMTDSMDMTTDPAAEMGMTEEMMTDEMSDMSMTAEATEAQ